MLTSAYILLSLLFSSCSSFYKFKLAGLQAVILALPVVERRRADPVLPAQVVGAGTLVILLEN